MKRFAFYLCISLAIMISMVAFPAVANAQDQPGGEAEIVVPEEIVTSPEVVVPEGGEVVIAEEEEEEDIVETVETSGSVPTLAAGLQASGLDAVLQGEGPYTLFAPTEEAFAALPAGMVEAWLADPTGELAEILQYHVIPGKIMAADLADGLQVTTAQGEPVTFRVSGNAAMGGNANIVQADIQTTNGVIHVIDTVLMPRGAKGMTSLPVTGGTAQGTTYIIVLAAVLGLLLGGSFVTRGFQRGA